MPTLHFTTLTMPAARLGPPNPLPPLHPLQKPGGAPRFDASVPAAERTYIGYGCDAGLLPYRLQDDYDSQRRARAFRVAVLENQVLRATFLLELGGRLWSLVHKPSGRELLYVNPVFQPRNLATRDAWFSGGVEWNQSIVGHSPFTCSPLFAAVAEAPDGGPMLRLYEWERLRGVPFQIDCYLPEGSPWLLVRVTLANPHAQTIPMYWWSNMAVREAPDVRVLTPTTSAYNHSYLGAMRRVTIPRHEGGPDTTYPTTSDGAADWFFHVPDGQRPWIAALDGAGHGLVQTSTARLRGRKMFVWGMSEGGRRWQEFLAQPGEAYLEIQAGLARTQGQCLPMPAGARWTWLEAYGLMEADAAAVHGNDWSAAVADVDGRLERALSAPWMDAELACGAAAADRPAREIVQCGSGWGALEERRRRCAGEAAPLAPGLTFDDSSLGPEQAPWLALLETGALPAAEAPGARTAPGAWLVQREWRELLEKAVAAGRGAHWLAHLHLGVMRFAAGDAVGAQAAWERALALAPSAWAWRNLAVLAQDRGDCAQAAECWQRAYTLLPPPAGPVPLAVEYAQAMLQAGRAVDLLADWSASPPPPEARNHPRLRFLRAQAELAVGDLAAVARFFASAPEVTGTREGEVALSDLWFAYHEQRLAQERGVPVDDALRQEVLERCPPPANVDFRASARKRREEEERRTKGEERTA